MSKKNIIREIENHLRHYKTYKIGVKNCEKQLDYLLPTLTASYQEDGSGSTSFSLHSKTEKSALDRIESKRALDLHEQIKRFELIIESIDNALEELTEKEKAFVLLRYIECQSITETAQALGYSEKNLFHIRKHVLDKFSISLGSITKIKDFY